MPIIEIETNYKSMESILRKQFYKAYFRLQKIDYVHTEISCYINCLGKQLVIADTLSTVSHTYWSQLIVAFSL